MGAARVAGKRTPWPRSSRKMRGLQDKTYTQPPETSIATGTFTQFIRRATLDDPAALQQINPVRPIEHPKVVRDEEDGVTIGVLAQGLQHQFHDPHIDCTEAFIYDENRRLVDQRAHDTDHLTLARRQSPSFFADRREQPRLKPGQEWEKTERPEAPFQNLEIRSATAQQHIGRQRSMEDLHVLGHAGDVATIIAEIEAVRRYAVDQDPATGQRVLSLEHLHQRTFAGSALTPQSGHPPSWQREVQAIEQHRCARPGEATALDGHRTSEAEWTAAVARLRLHQQQIQQTGDRDVGALQREARLHQPVYRREHTRDQ